MVAEKARHVFSQGILRQPFGDGRLGDYLAVGIVRVGLHPELELALVGLVEAHEVLRRLCRLSDEQHEQSRRVGVERARVAYRAHFQYAARPVHNVVRRAARLLVNQQNALVV